MLPEITNESDELESPPSPQTVHVYLGPLPRYRLLPPEKHPANLPANLPIRPPGGFPATNKRGQRICRQCGLPGRYKEGLCVEKWGPGPEGPGTVCDRCRKKMKRVERRGMLDPHSQPLAFVHPHPHAPVQERDYVHGAGAPQGTNPQPPHFPFQLIPGGTVRGYR